MFSPLVEQLITALRCLPGVGPKSAQRMALHLLERDRDSGRHLSNVLHRAMDKVGRCQACHIFCESALCTICTSSRRDKSLLCIVGSPADVMAIEQAGGHDGIYFVLRGHLSPIDGIGPEDIGLDELASRLDDETIQEVVLATNPTVEGEATAFYIAQIVKSKGKKASRIAFGVPMGGELEYVDGSTLAKALTERSLL